MRKTVILIFCIICIFALCSCNNAVPEESAPSGEIAKSESDNPPDSIPTSLIFTTDGNGRYLEPVLGEWEVFLTKVFKSFDSGEVDPGSGNIKYYGEGNDGMGYCFIVTTRSDSSGIISYNIDTAIISAEPNSGGDEVSGEDMVQWIYDHFHQ